MGGPNPNSSLGSYFDDGVRVGASFEVGGNSTPLFDNFSASPQNNQWGGGMIQSPIATYNIVPNLSGMDSEVNAATTGDICSFSANAYNANGVFTPSGGAIPNSGSTWTITLPNGRQALRFDWPRAIGIKIGGANLTDDETVVQVFGWDFYGNPMQAIYGGSDFTQPLQAIGSYQYGPAAGVRNGDGILNTYPINNEILPNPPWVGGPQYTNKAFYGITRVYLQTASPVPLGATISVCTTRIMGLPYAYHSQYSNLLGVRFAGLNEFTNAVTGDAGDPATNVVGGRIGFTYLPISGGIGTPYYASQASLVDADFGLTPSPLSYDVRGTYSPSNASIQAAPGEEIPRLCISWYQPGFDALRKAYYEAALPEAFDGTSFSINGGTGLIVPLPNLGDQLGQPQYFINALVT